MSTFKPDRLSVLSHRPHTTCSTKNKQQPQQGTRDNYWCRQVCKVRQELRSFLIFKNEPRKRRPRQTSTHACLSTVRRSTVDIPSHLSPLTSTPAVSNGHKHPRHNRPYQPATPPSPFPLAAAPSSCSSPRSARLFGMTKSSPTM